MTRQRDPDIVDDTWLPNYPLDYILPRFDIWVASGYQVYPSAGGMDDQPDMLIEDFLMLRRKLNLRRAIVKQISDV